MAADDKELKNSRKDNPKIVKLNKAFKLAETWVSKMSGPMTSEQNEVEFEGRPPRLGLGAKITKKMEAPFSTDPVERKLVGKLKPNKFSATDQERSNPTNETVLSQDDDEEPESRTDAFVKKRQVPLTTSMQSAKRNNNMIPSAVGDCLYELNSNVWSVRLQTGHPRGLEDEPLR